MAAGQALMKAEDCAGFVRALESYVAPMQNMVCADTSGHIALIAPGRVPIRSPENNTLGLIPAPGWKSDYDWIGYVPFETLPQSMDPARGYIATANNRMVSDSYPYLISLEWETDERVRRIEELIQTDRTHTAMSFAAMQMDQVSLFARGTLPSMIALLKSPPPQPQAKEALQLLSAWDGTMAAARPEPLIFTAWLYTLTRALIADELGEELFSLYVGPSKSLLRKLVEGDALVVRWCDDKTTPNLESCAAILSESLARAVCELIAQQGPKPSRWRWGRAHEARFSHRLGAFPLFGGKLVRRIETGGGMDTIDRGQMYFRSEHPFANVHGAGYRAIYDLNDPEASLFIVSTGQSGNPLSPHYDDLIEAWALGTYLPMATRRETLEKDGVSLLRLVPLGRSTEAKP
jgi:penicillin amidase